MNVTSISYISRYGFFTQLTLCHTIPTFNDHKEEGFGKPCGKKKKNAGNQHFLLFPQCFQVYHKEKSSFYQRLICLQMLSIWSCPKMCRLVKGYRTENLLYLGHIEIMSAYIRATARVFVYFLLGSAFPTMFSKGFFYMWLHTGLFSQKLTTHVRLFQTEKKLQTTVLNWMEMAESSPKGKKTLLEKEKFLVMSNVSFSYSVFKRLVLQTRKNQGLFGKGLNSGKVKPQVCLHVCYMHFE